MQQIYKPTNLVKWTHSEHYFGSTFYNYYRTGIGQSRDSYCLERANFASMLEKLGGESETVIINHSGHWGVGWVESILIHESDIEKIKLADKIMKSFNEYPVIDETNLSELENDGLQSTIDNYQDEFRELVCSLLDTQFDDLTKIEQDEVDIFINEIMYEDRSYHGVEKAFVTEQSIQRAIECSQYWNSDSNLIQFLQIAFNIEKKS